MALVRAKGEDRSNWQKVGPWTGLDFGFTKATEGLTFIDATFPANWALMEKEMHHRGAYHFIHPHLSPVLQAEFFMAHVEANGLGVWAPLVVDSEIFVGANGQLTMDAHAARRSHLLEVTDGSVLHRDGTPLELPTMTANDCTAQFLGRVRELRPHNPILLYTNKNVGSTLVSCAKYAPWIAWPAYYPPDMTGLPWPTWDFWQWAFSGGFDGADRDVFRGDAAALNQWIDSFGQVPPDPFVPTADVTHWHADGLRSLEWEAARFRTTPEEMLEIARQQDYNYGHSMQAYIARHDWNRRVPAWSVLFAKRLARHAK
jgi:GH25 family lysozyme M1 (1,4-beta-N-acetylmuramidase)